VPSRLRGRTWAEAKQQCERELIGTLKRHSTNIDASNVLATHSHSPDDMEALNSCFVGGVPSGGERSMAQMGYFRPFPGYSQYRSPIRKLYMAGPSCHPGNGISGMGVITAGVMLEDLGVMRRAS
jgi:phytoene dehydrogenase-like protein